VADVRMVHIWCVLQRYAIEMGQTNERHDLEHEAKAPGLICICVCESVYIYIYINIYIYICIYIYVYISIYIYI